MGRDTFLSALDLVALALIPKLAAHFNHLNAVLRFGKGWGKKKRETNPVGENLFVCLPVWAHTITEVVIAMNKIVFGVQQLEKNKVFFVCYISATISTFGIT